MGHVGGDPAVEAPTSFGSAMSAGSGVTVWRMLRLFVALALPLAFAAWSTAGSELWAIGIIAGLAVFAALDNRWTWLVVVSALITLTPMLAGQTMDRMWLWVSAVIAVVVFVVLTGPFAPRSAAEAAARRQRSGGSGAPVVLLASPGTWIVDDGVRQYAANSEGDAWALVRVLKENGSSSRWSRGIAIGGVLIAVAAALLVGGVSREYWTTRAFERAQASMSVATSPVEGDGTSPVIAQTSVMPEPSVATSGAPAPTTSGSPAPQETLDPNPVLGSLDFFRGTSTSRVVSDRTLRVGNGVDDDTLAQGPGRYPTSGLPGRPGNLAIAGHRTGWGSPFLELDQLRSGDTVVVTSRDGTAHRYEVVASQLVQPDAAWVLDQDPLGTGIPTLTLTTCDPPHTSDRRLVVFAELRA
jgi:sortase A